MGHAVGKVHFGVFATQHVGCHWRKTCTHLRCGIHDGCTIDVGTTRSRCGRCIGHLLRIGACDANIRQINAQTIGTDLGHFGIQALAHFSSTMVHTHRAIHVDVKQGAALVQHGRREADAKLQGHQSQTALAALVHFVKRIHAVAALTVFSFRGHLGDDLVAYPVGNGLAILRDHGGRVARHSRVLVDVEHANIQRIFANVIGNLLDDGLNAKHALWAPETAEGCGALGVGFAAVADEF